MTQRAQWCKGDARHMSMERAWNRGPPAPLGAGGDRLAVGQPETLRERDKVRGGNSHPWGSISFTV